MNGVRTETLYASAARTATPTAAEFDADLLRDAEVLEVQIVSTAINLTPSVVPTIEVYNELAAAWMTVLTGAAITTGSASVRLLFGPNVAASANVAAQGIIGRRMRLKMTHADTDSITYSALLVVKDC